MRRVLMLFCLLIVSLSSISQNTSNDVLNLERHHGKLRYLETNNKLDKVELQQLLDEEQFAIYEKARKQHVASIPLWTVTGVTTAASTFLLYLGVHGHVYYNNHPELFGCGTSGVPMFPFFYMFSAMGYGVSLLPAIPAIVLTKRSHKNLDNIVENYNRNSTDVTLNFEPTNDGIGLVLKF